MVNNPQSYILRRTEGNFTCHGQRFGSKVSDKIFLRLMMPYRLVKNTVRCILRISIHRFCAPWDGPRKSVFLGTVPKILLEGNTVFKLE